MIGSLAALLLIILLILLLVRWRRRETTTRSRTHTPVVSGEMLRSHVLLVSVFTFSVTLRVGVHVALHL